MIIREVAVFTSRRIRFIHCECEPVFTSRRICFIHCEPVFTSRRIRFIHCECEPVFTSALLPPLGGHISDVMLVWRTGNIEKTVSVLQYCVLL